MTVTEVRAALRDASFSSTHRQTDSAAISYIPAYHVVRPAEPFLSRCGVLIDGSTEVPAASVFHRCQRPGCKQAWPTRGGDA